jgi:hypothetical protein
MGMKPVHFRDRWLCVGFSAALIGNADGKKMKTRTLTVEGDEDGKKRRPGFFV